MGSERSLSAQGRSCNLRWLIFSPLLVVVRSAISDPLSPNWLSLLSSLASNAVYSSLRQALKRASVRDDVLPVDSWGGMTISSTLKHTRPSVRVSSG